MTENPPIARTTVIVELGDRTYPIEIGPAMIDQAGELLAGRLSGKKILIVTNKEVNRLWGDKLRRSLIAAGYTVATAEMADGEEYKNLETLSKLYDACVEAKLNRSSAIVALGGGITGDVAGYLAATYMRGIDFVQVPTTLLAQVDSSVGGKVAVNHRHGKNMIGAFYQPKIVIIDTNSLSTLPKREVAAGYGEVLKTAILGDRDLFAYLEKNAQAVVEQEADALRYVIAACCWVKAKVVAADERESGLRAILNLGHTFGHAIETLTEYKVYKHGEAVAVGLIAACNLAEKVTGLSPDTTERVRKLVEAAGLPTRFPDFPVEKWKEALMMDKKNTDSGVVFVVPTSIGEYCITPEVSLSVALESIETLTI
ncbi:3-dehydroquinate synthase [Heliobacillus mobilis]|uniref:3-dehydroquinate synthase n=2 Tax=Heliobacterium mobile TaxID=28064 RepID=A0A6I3SKE2_HELMO|nr:3-dehydroquinate synthase [Heliobacterium mobile]